MLRQIEVQMAQGKSIAVVCEEADVSEQGDPPLISRPPLIRSDRAGKVFDGEDETGVHA